MDRDFYVDDYFHIGYAHISSGKPCQDYSFSGLAGKNAFAVVSDGCSTGRHTDVGARIIALSTVSVLQKSGVSGLDLDEVGGLVAKQHKYALAKSGETFNLELQDMLATCIYALLTPKFGLIGVQGDGVIAKVYKDGSTSLISYQWDNNTPLYPAYEADNYGSFIRAHGDNINNRSLKVERHYYGLGSFQIVGESITLGEAIKGVTEKISSEEMDKLSLLAIFTDGVMQVDGINWKDAVLGLLAFKNLEGEFAKRRMIRFIKDSKKNEKRGPLDDISFAVIRNGEVLQEGIYG